MSDEYEVSIGGPRRAIGIKVAYTTINGRRYPIKVHPHCPVCQSIHRPQIEQSIITGMTYSQVIREHVEPHDHHSPKGAPTMENLTDHVRARHMPTPFSVQRDIIEQRAKELGKGIEDGEGLLTDSLAMFRSIATKGFEMMNEGIIAPTMADTIRALQLQQQAESMMINDPGADGVEAWRAALMEYMSIVQKFAPPEVFQQIAVAMHNSPVLRSIAKSRTQISATD